MAMALSELEKLRGQKILVIGDLILDRYTWGNAERVSPEAPVLVLHADQCEVRAGGAASVATMLRHLEAEVTLAGVIGDDAAGQTIYRLLDDEGIDRELVTCIDGRPTTTKERFLGRAANRHAHQILRVDRESRNEIESSKAVQLAQRTVGRLPACAAVIVSDYAKGVCAPGLLNAVINAARDYQIPVIVDPARISDYSRYHRASLITPNLQEAELASGTTIREPSDAIEVGRRMAGALCLDAVFVTLDRDGIAIACPGYEAGRVVPAQPREVYDITGAGDMVVAMCGLCLAAGLPLDDTARLANIAAGLEIEQLGVASVTWPEILACWEPHSAARDKILSRERLVVLAETYRRSGKVMVFTNGCFDLLHIGHVTFLEEAASLGHILIVAINSDASVRRLKGASRPVVPERDRAAMLAALACIDHVLVFDEETPHELLRAIRPDVLVKGGTTVEVIGREIVESYGGRVCIASQTPGVSTTTLVAHIAQTKQQLVSETAAQNPRAAANRRSKLLSRVAASDDKDGTHDETS